MYILLLLATACFPLLSLIPIVAVYCRRRSPFPAALLIGIAFGIAYLGYENRSGRGDYYVYAEVAAAMASRSFDGALEIAGRHGYKDYIIAVWWMWTVGKTGFPKLFLFTNALIEYSVLTYILFDYAKHVHASNKEIVVGLFLIIAGVSPYMSIASIRSTPALALSLAAFYLDYVRGFRSPVILLLYVIPLGIHAVGIAFIVFRSLLQLGRRHPLLITIPMTMLVPMAYYITTSLRGLVPAFMENAVRKLIWYVNDTTGEWAVNVSTAPTYIILRYWNIIYCIVLILALYVVYVHTAEDRDGCDRRLCQAGIAGLALTVGIASFITVPSYFRFTYVFYPLAALPAMRLLAAGHLYLGERHGMGRPSRVLSIVRMLCSASAAISLLTHVYYAAVRLVPAPFFRTAVLGLLSL